MRNLFFISLLVLFVSANVNANVNTVPVPQETEAVMLQAFHWNSYQNNNLGDLDGRTKWIDLLPDTTNIRENFDLVWFPPSGKGGGVGYYPTQWSVQDGDWGSKANLKKLIQALHRGNTQVLADIVVNHHQSSSGYGVFAKENFGVYGEYQLTQAHICARDEAFTDTKSNIYGSSNHGAADTGDNDSGCRDLDHTSTYVQDCVKAYVQWMRTEMGYDGFRYDMVKGYHGRYVAMYNRAANPTFSVAECFDGSMDVLRRYIDASEYTTYVFDFAAKFNVFNNGIGKGSYGLLKQTNANKLHRDSVYGGYAVTFIDNHDTFNRGEGNEYGTTTSNGSSLSNAKKILEANAYLLSMPGVPCVFYPHWKTYPSEINAMIAARKLAGVHSRSAIVSEATGGANRYEAVVQGHHGKLMLRIGTKRDTTTPDGYVLYTSGVNYHIFVEASLTACEQVPAETNVQKVMRDGQVIIVRDGEAYSVMGQKM